MLVWAKYIKNIFPVIATLLPLSLFVWFTDKISTVKNAGFIQENYDWVPQLGVGLQFRMDGLSLLFSLMITGIGTLVFWYTSSYLKGHKYLDRFYAYLCIFMAAMLGMVLSDNLITMFIFWELTSISSFFLIGFNNEEAPSRKSALMALLITGTGGFMLLAGSVLLGFVSDTYTISEMLASRDVITGSSYYPAIAILFFLAAFTKSAQFPFHFWLPGAMKAPTPVSTYLHSATMVKAGVYLLIRFSPILGNTQIWNNTLMITGGITMVYAAVTVLYKSDLKSILAYTTVSSLGVMVFLTGIGTNEAILAVVAFIITHALYKASLFLITGIIDHETGTRDINRLAGLRKVLMPVAVAGLLAAIISGGVPPTLGFISKDLTYEATLQHSAYGLLLTAAALITNIFLFYGGFAAGVKPFMGKMPDIFSKVHMPAVSMWLPPIILVAMGVVFGLMPGVIESTLVKPATLHIVPGFEYQLKLWHGFNTVLLLSALTIATGLLLFFVIKSPGALENIVTKYNPASPEKIFEIIIGLIQKTSRLVTKLIQNGYLRHYVFVTVSFLLALLLYVISQRLPYHISFQNFSEIRIYELVIIGIMITAVITTSISQSRLFSVASLGILGFSICTIFVLYSAPDLAMTQFSVDILTVILFVFVLFRLPRILKKSKDGLKLHSLLLAGLFGITISFICLKILNEAPDKAIAQYYTSHAYTLAKGKNVVNVILVDFRGIDTFIEICVLIVAALGVFSLIKISLKEKY